MSFQKKYTTKPSSLHVEEVGAKLKFLYELSYPFYIDTELFLLVVRDYLDSRIGEVED